MATRKDPFEGQFSPSDVQGLSNLDAPADRIKTQIKQKQADKQSANRDATMTGGTPNKIIIDPVVDTNNRNGAGNIAEAKEKHGVFAFGRFNPPTVGHEKLIHATEKVAKDHDVGAHIVASHSEGSSKNPVPAKAKAGYLKKVAASSSTVTNSSKEAPTFLQHAAQMHKQGVTHLHMVAGSDRVEEYSKKLHEYNGTHPKALYNFKSITVHSAGQRDPDAEGTEGMSGTKMRALAHAGKHKEFKAGLPKALHPHAQEIGDHIRAIKEDMVTEAASVQTRVKRSITMRRYKTKIHRAKEIARKRLAGKPQLNRRSLKQAKDLLRKRFAGKRGASYSTLGRQDKIAVDRLLDTRKALIKKVAGKIYNRVKQNEFRRFATASGGKSSARAPMPVMASMELSFKDHIALIEKSVKNNITTEVIFEVYQRGVNEWNESFNSTKQQHAFARVNSYVARGKAYELDNDLHGDKQ
jgi:hypothetical protein